MSHSLIVSSKLPEASVLPSGLYATAHTQSVWPSRVARSLPVATSHSLIVLSLLPEASVLPSWLYAREYTVSACPLSVSRSSGSWADSGPAPRQATPSHTITDCIRSLLVAIAHPHRLIPHGSRTSF